MELGLYPLHFLIMTTFDEKLKALLKTEQSFLDKDWELLEWKLQDSARNADEKLIKLLITDEEMRNKFFPEIAWYQVFNGNLFIEYISNKNFLDNSYTKYKNKIWLQINGKFLKENWDVELVRPFKDCVLEWWQSKEDEKKKEIFFNEILAQDEIDKLFAPKVLTNFKKFDKDWEQKVEWFKRDENGIIKDNLIIKWNNLLALHTLKKEFEWKINLIYIDPPYNTWNDWFNYNDNFNRSSRLTFMKNRLEVAKDLLTTTWSIYVQIDTKESHYLKVLMDEIFWKNNFRSQIIRDTSIPYVAWNKRLSNNRIYSQSTIFYYAKDKTQVFFNKLTFDVQQPSWDISHKPYKDVRTDIKNFSWFLWAKDIKIDFNTRKPEHLMERILLASSNPWDIVLDYHLWSWTTCAVAHKMWRQYIWVEQMDYIETISVERLKSVIDWENSWISKSQNRQWWWEFIYCELKKYNQEFIEQIEDAKSTDELLNIRENMKEKAYFKYNFDMQKFEENMDYFKNWTNSLKEQKELLVEILNKNQLYVNLSDIDDENFKVSDEDKNLNSDFYFI